MFGEANRCPHCNAIAAVKPSGEGYVCIACGKPRDRLPGTTVLGEPDARMSIAPAALSGASPRNPVQLLGRGVGLAGMFATLAAFALLTVSGPAFLIALAAGLVGLGAGYAMIESGRTQSRERAGRIIEQRILALAKKHRGDLTATEVAASLRISTTEADAALARMSDGTRITAEIDESVGVLHFVFHELKPEVPKTRVEIEGGEPEPERERERARERERERERE